MYETFFGFTEKPFSLNPDPDFLYLGRKHRMALTMLEYGLMNDAGIIVITGEIGSGKTTLIRYLLGHLGEDLAVGLIAHTHRAFGELIQWIAMAFGLAHENCEKVTLYSRFVDFLIAEYGRGRRTVLIVDEAQNMEEQTLEELRVISNINADKNLVLQLILVGQPELRRTLTAPAMEQFAQRIAVDYHLEALDAAETRAYIHHRIARAGGPVEVFEDAAIDVIFEHSAGVPRLINSLCDTALVYAFADERRQVGAALVREMVAERQARGLFGAGRLARPAAPTDGSGNDMEG